MKRKILFFVMIIAAGLMILQSCTEEEGTITSYGAFTRPALVAPANDTYIDVSGTTVELKWSSTDADNDPQKWDIYFGTSSDPDMVKANHNSQTYTVTVAKGEEYFWSVVGTDALGVPTRSETWSFKVLDPDADLDVEMSWETDVLDAIGLDLDPDEAVDMRMLIIRDSDKAIVLIADGASFESSSFGDLPDGTYLIATDLFSTIDAGDFDAPINLDIELQFNQAGILDETLSFPQVITNETLWDELRVYLAKVTKTGGTYTIEKSISNFVPVLTTWNGIDADYPSEVTTLTGNIMSMLGGGWMLDWWGEIIVGGGSLFYLVDGSGNITIPYQYYCTTTYNGAVQPSYYVEGTGTLDNSGAFPVIHLQYDFIQAGTSIGELITNYGWPTPYFEADITTDPSGKGSGAKGVSQMRPPKPNR